MKIQLQNITQFCLPEGQQNLLQIAVAEKNQQQEEVGIYQINPIDTLQPFAKLASVPLDLGVNIMTWKEHPKYQQGVLVIGTKDGCLIGIDVKKFKEDFENEQESFYVFSLQIYEQGSIQSLQYNFFKEDFLAVGDKELYIINFQSSFESPDIFCPFQANAPANKICSIGWNKVKTVQHILACAQDNGKINIIDLKVKKSIFNFSDGKENLLQRNICLTWFQNSPTQLAVGFDNEDSGVQIWDLKHAKGPIKKIPGLGQVINIEWKVEQRNVILCANRQGKLIVYGYETDSILHQFSLKGESILCSFVPNCAETYAVLSNEKELNILTQNQQQLNEKALLTNNKAKQEDFICSILPSGKVMSCLSNKQNEQDVKDFQQSVFEIFSENDEGLSNRLEILKKLLNNKNTEENYQLLKESMEHDHELLMLINHLDQSPQNKQQILCLKEEEILQRTEQLTGEQYLTVQKTQHKANTNLLQEAQENDAQDFFSNLGAQNNSENEQEKMIEEDDKIITKTIQYNQDWTQGTELLIKQNIFIGNLQGAIDLCLKTYRVTEALLIAKSHPTESQKLIEQIIQKLTAQNQEEFVCNFLIPFSQKNYQSILQNFQTKNWKETLYFIINSIKNAEIQKQLQNKFIQNLKDNNETEILQKVQLFLNNHIEFKEGLICSILSKQSLLEQIDQFILFVFYSLKTKEKAKGKMGQILLRFSNILLDQGLIETSLNLLTLIGDHNDIELKNNIIWIQIYFKHLIPEKLQMVLPKSSTKFPVIKKQQAIQQAQKINSNLFSNQAQNQGQNLAQNRPGIFEAKANPLVKSNTLAQISSTKVSESKSNMNTTKIPIAPPIKPQPIDKEIVNEKAESSFISQQSVQQKPATLPPRPPGPPLSKIPPPQSSQQTNSTTTIIAPPQQRTPPPQSSVSQTQTKPPTPVSKPQPAQIMYNQVHVKNISEFIVMANENVPSMFQNQNQANQVLLQIGSIDQKLQKKDLSQIQVQLYSNIVENIMNNILDKAEEIINKHKPTCDLNTQETLNAFGVIINAIK